MFTISEKISFIESAFGKGNTANNLTNIEVRCPICDGQKPTNKKKLAIRLADDVTHCWVCGFSSRSLLPLLKRFGTQEELQQYKEKFATIKLGTQQPEEKEVLRLPEGFRLLALCPENDRDARDVKNYLYDRGLSERDLWYFKFGVSNALFRRVIMPSFDSMGSLNFFTARAIDSEKKPKYIDPAKEIVLKTEIIFNEINIDWTKEIVIVEGPFDMTKCPDNSTCLQGNQLSESTALFNEIIYHDVPVCLMLDDDAKLRSSKIAKHLSKYGIRVRCASLGSFHDPGEMTKQQVMSCIASAKNWEWEDHIREKFNSIRL